MPDQWQKVKDIFEQAMALTADERPQFLDEACADDGEVRREVEELLSSLDESQSFLEQPAVSKQKRELSAGQMIGRYEVVRQIGAGAMGEVYLSTDTQLKRSVALKLLPGEFSFDKEKLQRFEQEAFAASSLNHPNILTIYEIGSSDSLQFIATEYVDGETIRTAIGLGKMTLEKAVDVAVQITSALAAAHEAGIIHRDIKPENVMIRRDGLVKVLDFGLAKSIKPEAFADKKTTLTQRGMIMGTVAYMSPEQTRGQSIDQRSDLWSLGVVIYEMIAGRVPFKGESSSDTIAAILKTDPDPLPSKIPAELRNAVARLMAKDRHDRPSSANELLVELRRCQRRIDGEELVGLSSDLETRNLDTREQADGTEVLRPDTQIVTSAGHKRPIILAAVIVGLALIGTSAWYLYFRRPVSGVYVQRIAQVTDWSGLDDFPAISPDGNSVAYCSDHNGNFEIYIKSLTPGAKEFQLTNDGKQNFQPTWSPDGQRIAFHSKVKGGIWIIPSTGGDARQLSTFGTRPAFSPDGKQIAFQSLPLNDMGVGARTAMPPSTVWVVSANGGEPKQLTKPGYPVGGHGCPSWSPNGKRIAIEVDDYNHTQSWTIASDGSDPKRVTKEDEFGYEPVFGPDGKSVIFLGGRIGTAEQVPIDPDTGEVRGEATALTGDAALPLDIRGVSFSKDGKRIAFSPLTRREAIAAAPLRSDTYDPAGEPRKIIEKVAGRIHQPSFAADGKSFLYTACLRGGSSCDIWRANADGSDQTQITDDVSNELMGEFLPGTQEVTFSSDRSKPRAIWAIDLSTKRERKFLELKNDIAYYKIAPDGKTIVLDFEMSGQTTNIWSASLDGGEPKQLTFDNEFAGFPALSRDGKWVAYQVKRGDDTFLHVLPIEGGTPEQITFDRGQSWAYSFAPDNDKVVFAGLRDGLWNVYWVSRTTKKVQKVTDYKKINSFVRYPEWSPTGEEIVYEYTETTGNVWVADLK